jgi:hypothetical protein
MACGHDVVKEPVHFVKEAVEALSVLHGPKAHLREGVVQVGAQEAE